MSDELLARIHELEAELAIEKNYTTMVDINFGIEVDKRVADKKDALIEEGRALGYRKGTSEIAGRQTATMLRQAKDADSQLRQSLCEQLPDMLDAAIPEKYRRGVASEYKREVMRSRAPLFKVETYADQVSCDMITNIRLHIPEIVIQTSYHQEMN